MKKILGIAVLLFLPLVGGASAALADDQVQYSLTAVSDGIYMLKGRGGNIGLSVGADGVFMIDDQYAGMTDDILAQVATVSDQPVRFLLNTHWHGDHTGGNEALGAKGTLLVAHDNVRKRLASDQFMSLFNREVKAAAPGALPIVTFDSAVSFHLNGSEIRAIHVARAHTDGDAIIHFPGANVIHAGDVVFNGYYPFIDLDSGGSSEGIIAALDTMLALCDDETRIIPGHGALATPGDLRAYRNMMATVRERVVALVAEGKTLEQVQAAAPAAEYDEAWGGGFINPENFLKELYLDLSR